MYKIEETEEREKSGERMRGRMVKFPCGKSAAVERKSLPSTASGSQPLDRESVGGRGEVNTPIIAVSTAGLK